jgi:uncharacterized membrane protein YoaK (UPF0700 family)
MKGIIPYFGEKTARKRLDEVFSRDMLGSVIVGGHFNKIWEKVYNLIALVVIIKFIPGADATTTVAITFALLALWIIFFIVSLFVFVYWDKLERQVKEAAENVTEG